jgi:hypothetical protein
MISFKDFLTEKLNQYKKLAWDGSPKVGWWLDNQTITFYHGTHKNNLTKVMENGLVAPTQGPTKDWVSLTLDPNTAFGYASMSGESAFRAAGGKAMSVPKEDRVVLVLKLPKSYVESKMDETLKGNMGSARDHMSKEDLYKSWKKSDQEYYMTSEVRFPHKVESKYIVGYMTK